MITELLAKKAIDVAGKILESKFLSNEKSKTKDNVVPQRLSAHLAYVANWSSQTQIFGLGKGKETDCETIELAYSGSARRFRSETLGESHKTEGALLSAGNHVLLIGAPGAGKTTSLKRVARSVFQENEAADQSFYNLPLVIRLKELDSFSDIYQLIADVLGFEVVTKFKVVIEEKKKKDYDDDGKAIVVTEQIERKIPYPAIGEKQIDVFLKEFFDESQVVLFLDGLDELKEEYLERFLKGLQKFSLMLTFSKVIITARTGFYYGLRTLEGFDVLDILPLDSDQILLLASTWTNSPEKFVNALNASPYKDLADRPLLLSQLLFIYDRFGTLPINPKEIYGQIVELLLKEWDADRGIVRESKYSGFSPKRKSEFLSELAFRLMYDKNVTQFSSKNLSDIYLDICDKFELPESESLEVAKEIETHNGIIVSVGHSGYEFSHLSIQEYLCADYIVRSPLNQDLVDLIRLHPEPVAIAIALASDSTAWLTNLFTDQESFDAIVSSIGRFLTRLVLERPSFSPDDLLGFSLFYLYSSSVNGDQGSRKFFSSARNLPGVRRSIEMFLRAPESVTLSSTGRGENKQVIVQYTLNARHLSHSSYRKSIYIPVKMVTWFVKDFGLEDEELANYFIKRCETCDA